MNVKNEEVIDLTVENPIDCLLRCCENVRLGYHPKDENREKKLVETNGEIFCRGEPILFDTKLIPKIFRKENLQYEEADLLIEFQSKFPKYFQELPHELEWLSLMQHNGVPTRLLDWTTNPLVALYFSLSNPKYEKNDGFIYLMPIFNRLKTLRKKNPSIKNPTEFIKGFYLALAKCSEIEEVKNRLIENLCSIHDYTPDKVTVETNEGNQIIGFSTRPYGYGIKDTTDYDISLRDMIEIFPLELHRRIIVQSGKFTLHYGKYINGKKLLINDVPMEKSDYLSKLYTIKVPYKIKNTLLDQLRLMNIHEFSLFPEEDRFFNYFRSKNKMKKLEVENIEACSALS